MDWIVKNVCIQKVVSRLTICKSNISYREALFAPPCLLQTMPARFNPVFFLSKPWESTQMSIHAWRVEESPEQIRKLLHLDTNFAQFTIYKPVQFTKAINNLPKFLIFQILFHKHSNEILLQLLCFRFCNWIFFIDVKNKKYRKSTVTF